jgi:hypothetical protein
MGTSVDIPNYFTTSWNAVWLVAMTNGGLQGAQSLAFLEASSETTATVASFDPETAQLTVTADLHSLEQLVVQAGTPDITIDWSEVTTDGFGSDFGQANRLQVMWFTDETTTDLEADFKTAEAKADAIWEVATDGIITLVNLTGLTGNQPFNGFNDDGLWTIVLRDDYSTTPIPPFATVVDAVE